MSRAIHIRFSSSSTSAGESSNYLVGPLVGLFFASAATLFGFGSAGSLSIQVLVLVLMVLPAIQFALTRSTHLLPYILMTYVLAPEVRRVLDWSANSYTSVTLISTVPMAAALALLIPIFFDLHRLPHALRTPLLLANVALAYGLGIGCFRHGVAAIPEYLSWATPLLVVAYVGSRPAVTVERDNWLRSFAVIAVLVATYMWIQFITAPPWDMFWLQNSGMLSSGGLASAMEFRAFGPLNSTGGAGFFLPFVICAVWTAEPLRNAAGVLTGLLAATALAITQVRAGWLMAVAMILAGVIVRTGGSWLRQVFVLIGAVGVLLVVLPLLPGGDLVQYRASTFGDLQNDGSVNGRVYSTVYLINQFVGDPIGTGFGEASEGKVNGSSSMVVGIDSGYAAILVYFGWMGAPIFLSALVLLFRLAAAKELPQPISSVKICRDRNNQPLAIGALIGMFTGTVAFATFAGSTAFVGWTLFAIAFSSDLLESSRKRQIISR